MVDDTLILRKLADIEEYLRQIQEFRGITVQQYQKDWKLQRITARTF